MKCFIRGPMVVILLFFAIASYGQGSDSGSSSGGGITFGARVGSSFSFFDNDYRFQGGSPGLLVGGVVNYNLSDALQLTGGLDYYQLRGNIAGIPKTIGTSTVLRDNNLTIHTFDLNGLIGYRLPLSFLGDAAPYIQGGASIGYNAGVWNKYTARYISSSSSEILMARGKENIGGITDDFIATWMIGLRFETPLSDGLFSKMLIDIRFKSSFEPPIRPYVFNNSADDLGIRSLSASLGFIF